MKNIPIFIVFIFLILPCHAQTTWIRINQVGYLTDDVKVAVVVSKEAQFSVDQFEVCDAWTEKTVMKSRAVQRFGQWGAFENCSRLTFTSLYTEHYLR